MHSLLRDIPRFLILSLEELFLMFNQMLSIRAFGRRERTCIGCKNPLAVGVWRYLTDKKLNFHVNYIKQLFRDLLV